MPIVWVDPVNCTPAATGWQDVDLDAYVGGLGSNVTGVIIQIHTPDGPTFACRCNGSTDNFSSVIAGLQWGMIGVDNNHIFEIYLSSLTNVAIYIVGYLTEGFTFFVNGVDKSLTTTTAWTEIDCSSNCPNATGINIYVKNAAALWAVGLRHGDSTDSRTTTRNGILVSAFVGCSSTQRIDGFIGDLVVDFYITGYCTITGSVTFNINATDYSLATTGSWIDLVQLPAGAVGCIIECVGASSCSFGLRKNGSTQSIIDSANRHVWGLPQCDPDRYVEGYIGLATTDFWLIGYATAGTCIPVFMSQYRRRWG